MHAEHPPTISGKALVLNTHLYSLRRTPQALREAVDIPILGVCLGHEGLGVAHGARVCRAPEPMHGRLSPLFHGNDPLFRGVPQGTRVVRYHSLVVDLADSLEARGRLIPTAWTGDGVLMAMRHEERPHWGVQFHPESVGTKHGHDIVRNFRDLTLNWHKENGGRGGARREDPVGVNGESRAPKRVVSSLDCRAVPLALEVAKSTEGQQPKTAHKEVETPRRASATGRRSFVLHVQELSVADSAAVSEKEPPGGASAVAMLDTERAFRALFGDEPTAWWLDSSSQRPGLAVGGQAKARFSFMGGTDGPLSQIVEVYGEGRVVIQDGNVATEAAKSDEGTNNGGHLRVKKARRRREIRANILDYLKAEMGDRGQSGRSGSGRASVVEVRTVDTLGLTRSDVGASWHDERSGGVRGPLPFDFVGGFVGFLGYELRHEANDILEHSSGGTEWDWRPPSDGRRANYPRNYAGQQGASGVETTPEKRVKGEASRCDEDVPSGLLIFADRFVAFDHREGKAYVLALTSAHVPDDNDEPCADEFGNRVQSGDCSCVSPDLDAETLEWIRRTTRMLERMSMCSSRQDSDGGAQGACLADTAGKGEETVSAASLETTTVCAMDTPRLRYELSLEESMRLMQEGETYEVCLTNQIVCERPGGGRTLPLDLYSRLRRSNPAPYAAYIVHDPHRRLSPARDGGVTAPSKGGKLGPAFAVCCSSPERFLKVDRRGWVESKPIKGTVKR